MKDMKRIKSLNIQATHGIEFNFLKEEFDCIEKLDCDVVYIGQDWYIALKENEIISQCIYKIEDERQEIEITETLNKLKGNSGKNNQKCKTYSYKNS